MIKKDYNETSWRGKLVLYYENHNYCKNTQEGKNGGCI